MLALVPLVASALLVQPTLQVGRRRPLCMVEGLDAESDSVGPGIYGGRVQLDAFGNIEIGQQFEQHNALPGPVYAGGGYTELSQAIRTSPDAVRSLLDVQPDLAHEVTTGGATPLHVCAMSQIGQNSMALVVAARSPAAADVDAVDTWGYTALQRCATNNLPEGAKALLSKAEQELADEDEADEASVVLGSRQYYPGCSDFIHPLICPWSHQPLFCWRGLCS